jgi:hypothetical protein
MLTPGLCPLSEPGDPLQWQVPAFDQVSITRGNGDIALCIFVLNEAERLFWQLERTAAHRNGIDIIIADGGSTDGCADPDRLAGLGVNTLLIKRGPGKLSAQMRMALAHCLSAGYSGIIVMDGNNKDDPSALPAFADALERGFDHLQGSRFIPGGRAIRTPVWRYWGIKLLHAPLIRLASGFPYTDTTNGFRAYSRRMLLDPRVAPFRDVFQAYELHYYLAIRAAQLGLPICEIPVTRAYPEVGHVPTKIHGLRGNWKVLQTLFAACMGRFDPEAANSAA